MHVQGEKFGDMMGCLTKGSANTKQQQDAEYMIQFLLNKVKDQGDYMAEFNRWAANGDTPLTREQQIELMRTAKERHDAFVKRIKEYYDVEV
jgi:hypothetical protein